MCLGGFRNVRTVFDWKQLKLELDETQYDFGTSYEIECESDGPEGVKKLLEGFLMDNGISREAAMVNKAMGALNSFIDLENTRASASLMYLLIPIVVKSANFTVVEFLNLRENGLECGENDADLVGRESDSDEELGDIGTGLDVAERVIITKGQEFPSSEVTFVHYVRYAKAHGFAIRKQCTFNRD
ncbi:hypothetical protein NE237_030405 [Protea cynaroides]|uniref:CYTH domain-containing protein n=1 Tax=Protea cynaroides TaxID=273540 RepID=A0A9Q0GVV7_9MAGN|nr:hypothetical protein NE237_030405 [Protea cynaroides]